MSKRIYDVEFKLHVVTEYFKSNLGIRLIARSFGLPSKNYLTRWIEEMKTKGLIPKDVVKQNIKTSIKPTTTEIQSAKSDNFAEQPVPSKCKSPVQVQLENDNLRLNAEVDFLKKLQMLRRGNVEKI